MRHIYKIILILILFSCNNNKIRENVVLSNEEYEETIEQEVVETNVTEKIDLNFDKEDSVFNYKFSIAPIDSFMEILYPKLYCDLAEMQLTEIDSINKYTNFLDMFSEKKGLESIFFKFREEDISNFNEISYITGMLAFIMKFNFDNDNNAQNSFSTFSEDLLKRELNFVKKIPIKVGAICFVESSSIYIIRVNTCGSKDMDKFEKVIREQVFNNKEFKGIKVYCGLKNPQILKF